MSFSDHIGGRLRPLALAAAGLALSFAVMAAPARATNLVGTFSGNAYATYANVTVGPLAVGLGASAYIPCPCQGSNGVVLSNDIAALSVGTGGSVLKFGAATSTTVSSKTTSTATVTDTSTIAGINLLGGLITADAIKAVATVSATASTITPSFAGSNFVNLKVAGQPIDVNVAPNTTINLAGLGTVTLKKVVSGASSSSGTMKVEMISIAIGSANSFGLPVGVTVVVGHALSGFSRVQPLVVVGGQAYGAYANAAVGSLLQLKVGQPALVSIPCLGTNGKILTNNVAGVTVAGILTLGASSTTAFGGTNGGTEIARTSAQVAGISLLGGLVGATAITAVAEETVAHGVRTRSTAGTQFADLKVLGIVLPINIAPNTTLDLPLIGKVVLNEQIIPTTGGKTIVNGIHIYVTSINLLGLPIGSEILVAHADAFAFTFPT